MSHCYDERVERSWIVLTYLKNADLRHATLKSDQSQVGLMQALVETKQNIKFRLLYLGKFNFNFLVSWIKIIRKKGNTGAMTTDFCVKTTQFVDFSILSKVILEKNVTRRFLS